jgi:hypothetical protein
MKAADEFSDKTAPNQPMSWLGEELPEQDGRTPFAPRCRKDVVEERLFAHRRDLLTRLDLEQIPPGLNRGDSQSGLTEGVCRH